MSGRERDAGPDLAPGWARVAVRLPARARTETAHGTGIMPIARAPGALALTPMPRFWIWIQVAIFVFVIAAMVIAVTKLA